MKVNRLPWKSPHSPDASMYGSMPGNGDGIRDLLASILAHGRGGGGLVERADAADAVPRVLLARGLALALVALREPRDEELLRQRRQEHAARAADRHQLVVVLELHHLRDRPRLRRVV